MAFVGFGKNAAGKTLIFVNSLFILINRQGEVDIILNIIQKELAKTGHRTASKY